MRVLVTVSVGVGAGMVAVGVERGTVAVASGGVGDGAGPVQAPSTIVNTRAYRMRHFI